MNEAAVREVPDNALRYFPSLPRLGEFDLGGVLYHARYFHIYEDAREKVLRDQGLPYSDLITTGFHLVVVETEQKFHLPLRYGQTFELALWITDVKRSTMVVRYRLLDENGRNLHSAMTKHVLVKKRGETFETARFTEPLRSALLKYAVPAKSTKADTV